MNAKVQKLWAEALESGEFRQETEVLRADYGEGYGYCCLGVLCEVYRRETGDGEWDDLIFKGDGYASECALPVPVAEWAGISTNPTLDEHYSATQLNDQMGFSFPKIAKLIRALPSEETA